MMLLGTSFGLNEEADMVCTGFGVGLLMEGVLRTEISLVFLSLVGCAMVVLVGSWLKESESTPECCRILRGPVERAG